MILKKIKCFLGFHKLGVWRNVTNKTRSNEGWGITTMLRNYYGSGGDTSSETFKYDASCVNCGLHFSKSLIIPGPVVQFYKDEERSARDRGEEYGRKDALAKKKKGSKK